MAKQPDPVRADFRNFLYLVWRHLGLPDPTPLQNDIAYHLQHGPDRMIIAAFRGAAKSWITAAYVLWRLHNDPNLNIVVISAAKVRSDAFSQFCLRLIHEMPLLQYLKARAKQRDSLVSFDVGPAGISQSPSVQSIGIFGTATGFRADEVIADDVEVPNNSETQTMREKLDTRVKEFDALLKPGGKIKYLGTFQTEDSLYRKLIERGYRIRIWPVLYPDDRQILAYEGALAPKILEDLQRDPALVGTSTEPTRFTLQDIEARRLSYGRAGFAMQFMLDPRLSDADQYPLKLSDLIIRSFETDSVPENVFWSGDPEHIINDLPNVGMRGDRFRLGILPDGDKTRRIKLTGVAMAIDPAGRGKDETAYAIAGVSNGRVFLLDAGGLQGYGNDTLTTLATLAKQFGVNHVRVEANFGDGMFLSLLKPVLAKIHPCSVDEVRSTGQKEKRIIDTLEPVISGHRLVVNRELVQRDFDSTSHLPPEQANRYRLFYQMTRITKAKGSLLQDDRLDAVSIVVAYWSAAVGRDIETAVKQSKDKALQAELDKFLKHAVGGSARRPKVWTRDR